MRYRTLRFYQAEILTQCQYALSAHSGMVQTFAAMGVLNQVTNDN